VFGAATRGGVNILANEGSHRETGQFVGYTAKQRFMGEQAQAQKVSNFKNTVRFFSRFLGMSPSNPQFEEEAKYLSVKTTTENDEIGFQVNYLG
jgi:molecular chaperone DnaK (HSP70)